MQHLIAWFLKDDKRNSGEAGELVAEVVPRSTARHAVTGVNTREATREGTKVTTRFDLQAGGLFPLAEPVVRRSVRRGVQSNLDTLKDVLESYSEPSS